MTWVKSSSFTGIQSILEYWSLCSQGSRMLNNMRWLTHRCHKWQGHVLKYIYKAEDIAALNLQCRLMALLSCSAQWGLHWGCWAPGLTCKVSTAHYPCCLGEKLPTSWVVSNTEIFSVTYGHGNHTLFIFQLWLASSPVSQNKWKAPDSPSFCIFGGSRRKGCRRWWWKIPSQDSATPEPKLEEGSGGGWVHILFRPRLS